MFIMIDLVYHIAGNGTQQSPRRQHALTHDGKDPNIMPSPFTHRIIPLDKGWVPFAEGSWNLMVQWNTSSTERIILLMRNALKNITHHGGLNETSFNTSYWNNVSSLDLTDERCQDIKDLLQWGEVPPLVEELKCEKRWTSLENFLGPATTDDLQQIQNQLDQNLERFTFLNQQGAYNISVGASVAAREL